MACTVYDIVKLMEELAPPVLAEEWDRVGLQLGEPNRRVERVLVTLTVTPSVVAESEKLQIDLIVTHHPLIFRPITSLRWDSPSGALLRRLIAADINVYVAHTNFDAAETGTSQVLADVIGLKDVRPLIPHDASTPAVGMGRIGRLPQPVGAEAFIQLLSDRLQPVGLRHTGNQPERIERVAVMGGSGASFIREAQKAGAQAYVTGDMKFHDALEAQDLGLWVVDVGHYSSERIIVPRWKAYLEEASDTNRWGLSLYAAKERDPFQSVSTRPIS